MRNLNPYRIQLDKIRIARGGFTDDLKDKIISSSKDYCQSLDDDLPISSGWLSAESILNDFLYGKPFPPVENSAKHWYVVELLCNGFGKTLPDDAWKNASLDDFYDYDEFRMYFLGMDPLVRVPSPESYPLVFTIENKNLEKAKLLLDKSPHSDAEKNQFIDWVQSALDNDQDLILFSY